MSVSHKRSQTQHPKTGLRLAVSACLLGQKVRYDGGDKQDNFVSGTLSGWVELIPVCPEVEIGMGVPRPPIQVVEGDGGLRAVGVTEPGLDVTRAMHYFAASTARRLADVDGWIFKARSPSCGVSSTPQRRRSGGWDKGAGLFAAGIMQRLPLLPVVEECALQTPAQRINFIQRAEAYRHWREFVAQRPNLARLHEFHGHHRLSLMAHGAPGLRRLEAWLATVKGRLQATVLEAYGRQYMHQFACQATRRRHVIVLRHLAAHCRPWLDNESSVRLRQSIDSYARGDLPLVRLLPRLRALVPQDPLAGQSYLQPSLVFKLRPH